MALQERGLAVADNRNALTANLVKEPVGKQRLPPHQFLGLRGPFEKTYPSSPLVAHLYVLGELPSRD